MTKEKLVQEIMLEAEKDGEPVTREEAEEMAEMELKAKKNIKEYVKSAEIKPKTDKKPKEIKVSAEKIALFDLLWEGLSNYYGENAQIVKNNKEISVQINQKSFKIDLIEHRK